MGGMFTYVSFHAGVVLHTATCWGMGNVGSGRLPLGTAGPGVSLGMLKSRTCCSLWWCAGKAPLSGHAVSSSACHFRLSLKRNMKSMLLQRYLCWVNNIKSNGQMIQYAQRELLIYSILSLPILLWLSVVCLLAPASSPVSSPCICYQDRRPVFWGAWEQPARGAPGYQVLSDILFRLGLIANCSHTVQYFDCSHLNWRWNHYHLFWHCMTLLVLMWR